MNKLVGIIVPSPFQIAVYLASINQGTFYPALLGLFDGSAGRVGSQPDFTKSMLNIIKASLRLFFLLSSSFICLYL